jgi:hypothetical protein
LFVDFIPAAPRGERMNEEFLTLTTPLFSLPAAATAYAKTTAAK